VVYNLLRQIAVQGLITELHFAAAEELFPGIASFYALLTRKPRTFLELLWLFESECAASSQASQQEQK
jgi:hypothetical protein